MIPPEDPPLPEAEKAIVSRVIAAANVGCSTCSGPSLTVKTIEGVIRDVRTLLSRMNLLPSDPDDPDIVQAFAAGLVIGAALEHVTDHMGHVISMGTAGDEVTH